MPLPRYKATRFLKIIARGGHSKPWLIEAEADGCTETLVMKVFTPAQIEAKDCITNEVIGNVLAQEFDFSVPQAAFVHTPSAFWDALPDEETREALALADPRPKFASVFVETGQKVTPSLSLAYLDENIDLELLYAFDNVIRNPDRGTGKTNLLINDEEDIFLIDHELALESLYTSVADFKAEHPERFNKYHLAYAYLKAQQPDFQFTHDYLKSLSLSILSDYFVQLSALEYEPRQDAILFHLELVKNNPSHFTEMLQTSLQ
jgi:hypothetical protein